MMRAHTFFGCQPRGMLCIYAAVLALLFCAMTAPEHATGSAEAGACAADNTREKFHRAGMRGGMARKQIATYPRREVLGRSSRRALAPC